MSDTANSSDEEKNLPEFVANQEGFIKEFFTIQHQEILAKKQELEIRREEIKSNEKIALASISAQETTDLKRGDVFAGVHKGKMWLWAFLALIIAIVIVSAMVFDKPDIAMEIIKIGGAVFLGFFAGVNRGKAQALEKQEHQKSD